jgi:hypothetical protein
MVEGKRRDSAFGSLVEPEGLNLPGLVRMLSREAHSHASTLAWLGNRRFDDEGNLPYLVSSRKIERN